MSSKQKMKIEVEIKAHNITKKSIFLFILWKKDEIFDIIQKNKK